MLRLAEGVHELFRGPSQQGTAGSREAALFIAAVLQRHSPDVPKVVK